jgi:uncharacterized protein (DUF1499 family)
MQPRSRKLLRVLILLALPVLFLAGMSFFSQRPANLGHSNGRLNDCPSSPNCVCTDASDPGHHMEPISFAGSPDEARTRLRAIIESMPRAQIVTDDGRYLHVEFTSLVFRFVDDVELLIDPATRTIHFRSASRAGHSDMGVNRRRMEEIRRKYEAN